MFRELLILGLAYEPRTEEKKKIEQLSELLKNHGIDIHLNHSVDDDGRTWDGLVIKYDTKKIKRGAGRKSHLVKNHNGKAMRFSDVLKLREELGDDEVLFAELNISRATFFRKLKECKEFVADDPGYDPYF